jgi:hypothetical protein
MNFKYNFCFQKQPYILYIFNYIFPKSKYEKEYKMIYQQYNIKKVDFNQLEEEKNLHSNNILIFKNNILIILMKHKISDKNYFDKLWFYNNSNNIYQEIIDSYNNKLIKLNNKLYDNIIGDFKFRDIFILLYNNESF